MVRYDRTIPPGGVGQITLKVDTTGLRGRITKSAQVTTNDPQQRRTKIYLSMNIRAHIIVEPGPKIVLRGIVGEDIRRVLHIRPADNQPLEITKVTSSLGSAVEYKLSSKEGSHKYDLEVMSKATDKTTASGYIALHTNHPKKKVLKLSVHVRIRPELEVWPNSVFFHEKSGTGANRGMSKRSLTVRNNRGKNFSISELNYNKEYFQVRSLAKTHKPASKHQLEVTPLVSQLPAGRVEFRDTLIIKTDSSQAGELKVPLSIRLRQ